MAQAPRPEYAVSKPRRISLSELKEGNLPAGTRIITEGRYAGRMGNNLALGDSSLMFVLRPGMDIDELFRGVGDKTVLRVEGETALMEDTQRLYVKVFRLETAQGVVAKIVGTLGDPQATPESLYEIGREARSWTSEYPDERLGALARAAFSKGLKMEGLVLGPEDWQSYLQLAQKAAGFLDEPALYEFYVRKGIDAFVLAEGRRNAWTYYEAARKAQGLLPESALAANLLEKGFAIESRRAGRQPHRDYYALAQKAKEIFGEGARYRNLLAAALDDEHARVPSGDYAALYSLARKVREIYPDYGDYRVIVIEAILAEKSQMDQNDAGDWIRLGNRVLLFLDDKAQAALCFKEAFLLDPSNRQSGEKLREMGYVYYKGKWRRPEEFGRKELLEHARVLEELAAGGTVAVGMTREHVLRARGRPDEINACSGGWGRTEQWVYKGDDGRMYVSLVAGTVTSRGSVAPDGK
ncbi:MAG: hypothetical protein J7M19_04780 [Planctomycetes bacterium]|nr:hypothetical protein [Planctomycetota bacterium]